MDHIDFQLVKDFVKDKEKVIERWRDSLPVIDEVEVKSLKGDSVGHVIPQDFIVRRFEANPLYVSLKKENTRDLSFNEPYTSPRMIATVGRKEESSCKRFTVGDFVCFEEVQIFSCCDLQLCHLLEIIGEFTFL